MRAVASGFLRINSGVGEPCYNCAKLSTRTRFAANEIGNLGPVRERM